MFNKSKARFPVKNNSIFLSHCGVSPLYEAACRKGQEMIALQLRDVPGLLSLYDDTLENLREDAAALMKTSPENLAFVKNTSEGISMIANGYGFQPGDQVITYTHEYPANYYPWKLQERKGMILRLLPDRDITGRVFGGLPSGWSLEDL